MSITPSLKQPTLIICLSDGKGGMEIDAVKLQRNLQQVTECYLMYRDGTFLSELAGNDKKISSNSIGVDVSATKIKKFVSTNLVRETRRILKQKNIKNVIFFGTSEMKSLYFSFLGMGLNVIMRHGTTHTRSRKGLYYRVLYNQITRHVVISRHLANNIAQIFPVKTPGSIVIVYPSLYFRTDALRAAGLKNDKLKILHTGRIAPGKGHIDAIEACGWLYDNGIDFEFNCLGEFGDDRYMEEVRNLIKEKPYADKINLLGHVENVQDYLSHSDIFLFPSAGEGFCNSFHEALAAGLVCITYDNTAFSEVPGNGFYFHLIEDGNMAQLGEELLKTANNLEFELSKSRDNITVAKELFSAKTEMEKFSALLI